ncbi:outer membrane beta-barrel protein [Persephonella sp. KM09-Lau-8]|uniref:outer membrane beta-barrel protein n=1 Tax=Persephonella sp. KM09-Lau-8 TaxID=1158345 RepID=UPI0004962027|nr:outer membrane beta-barrel protein [Persephonella sp. KM09-Lau-8]
MKKVLGLAAAGLLAAGAAQAGTLTVANSDIVLYGGVSASFDWQNTDHLASRFANDGNNDNFHVSTFAIGLMKKADANSPIGFNAAFANFTVPTLVASDNVASNLLAWGSPSGDFKPWLAYVTIAPIEGLSIDAGLLWNKFGEAPLTILNRNYTRGILFTGHPVAYAGARVNYDAGIAQVYVGYNQGGGLRQGSGPTVDLNNDGNVGTTVNVNTGYNISDAFEAGISFNLSDFVGFGSKVGLHTYNEAGGRNLYVLCTSVDAGIVKAGVEVDYTNLDDAAKIRGADDSAWGVALNIDIDLLDAQIANVTFPIRIEYVDNGSSTDNLGSRIYLTGKNSAWSFTITPTWKPTKNTFARLEAAYISTDKKVFEEDDGSLKDNRTVLAFEAGFLF